MSKKSATMLTNLELEVMSAIWRAEGRPLTVREVAEGVNEGRGKPLAYNTVQTMLTILREKGAVRVKAGDGRAHLYVARRSRDEVATSMVDDLVVRLFGGEVQPLLVHLVDSENVGRDELEGLKRWIDARLDDREETP